MKTPTELACQLVDKALQVKLYHLPADSTTPKGVLQEVVDDLKILEENWRTRIREPDERAKTLGSVIHSTLVIFLCCCVKAAVSPSVARSAIREISGAASQQDPVISAQAFRHYPRAKAAFAIAQAISATGLQDEAADALFDSAGEEVEQILKIAFEDLDMWISAGGHDGGPMTVQGHAELVKKVDGLSAELRMALSQWSSARLEEQLDDMSGLLANLTLVLDTAGFLAAMGVVQCLCSDGMGTTFEGVGAKEESMDEKAELKVEEASDMPKLESD